MNLKLLSTGVFLFGVAAVSCADDSPPSHSVPSRLEFLSPPTDSATDLSLAPSVRVAVLDTKGEPFSSWNSPITISLVENPGAGALSGVHTVHPVDGVATFEGLSINATGTYSLVAVTAGGLQSAWSRPFSISAGGWFPAGTGLDGAYSGTVTIDPQSPNTIYFVLDRFFEVPTAARRLRSCGTESPAPPSTYWQPTSTALVTSIRWFRNAARRRARGLLCTS